nr:hypothetical protein [Nostoc sp. EkiNYC01]
MSKYSISDFQVGDRIITPSERYGTVSSVHKKICITWDNGHSGEYTPKQLQAWKYRKFLEDEKTQEAIASCNSNTPASLQESPVLNSELMPPEHQTLSKQNSSLKITPTLNQSLNIDFQKSPSTATSATITLNRDNSTFTQLDFLVLEHQLQETEPDLATQNQNSGLKPCGASQMEGQASLSLKILKGLSIEDYEQFLADSEWSAISGTIRSSYRLRKSERRTKETDSSLLPTPTTYAKGSTGCRPAGATRLEQKLRPYITKGDKLNPAVPGWMMGFPVGWAEYPLMDTGETISVQLPFIQEYATTSTNGEIVTTSTPDQSAPSRQQLQSSEFVISPNLLTQLKKSDVKVDLYICNSSLNIGKIVEVWETCFTVDWSSEIKCYFWERDDRVIGQLAIAPQHLIDQFLEDSEPLVLCPICELQHIYLSGGCGICGLEPIERTQQLQIDDKSSSGDRLSDNAANSSIECTQQLKVGDGLRPTVGHRVRITKTRTQNLSQWVGHEATVTGINGETISVAAGEGREKKHLTLKKGWYEVIPENFLEETERREEAVQKPKGRQRKGCLYRYIENKKLKNESIVSYPRVIGHREPSNPHHWRWGFSWEIKVDGEWKGRSIGSVPVGAIALIQSMQNEGVSLEEIIAFIRRAKAKK